MYFMGGLQITRKGHYYLFMLVYKLNKMCAIMPCKKTIDGKEASNIFFRYIWVHYGIPRSTILDNEKIFLNAFWTTLWEKMGMKLNTSITFHTRIDGKQKYLIGLWCIFLGVTRKTIQILGMEIWYI